MANYIIDPGNPTKLVFEDIPAPLNIYQQGQYSTELAALSTLTISDIAYPSTDKRPSIKDLTDMLKRDPIVSQCCSFKSLRAVQSFGDYTHTKKEIEIFVNSNLNTLKKSFKRTLFKLISSVILYGFAFAEFTFSSKVRGYQGQWRLASINVLNPEKIIKLSGRNGYIEYIEYDNGNGKIVKIPYKKCLHVTNNSGATYEEDSVWGIGDGIAALNYYKLKRVVLTQLALAAKNNSTGIVHVKVPNTGRTILVDGKMQPLKDGSGKPIEVTKQIALNYQLQDLYKKDFIVTDIDVEMDRIQVQNNEQFWEYVLNYIDRSIQRAFGIPIGIFDSGTQGVQNVGLSQNFKSVFDNTIVSLTNLLKEELINKIIKRLLFFHFPFDWYKDNYGEFSFDMDEDPTVANQTLSTISSLVASGLLDQNDPEIIALMRKKLGLPAMTEVAKQDKLDDGMTAKIQKEIQNQLQLVQLQQQLQMAQNPPPPPTDPNADPNAAAQDQGQYPPQGA